MAILQGEMSLTNLYGTGQTVGAATAVLVSVPLAVSGSAQRLEARLVGYDSANGNAVSLARAAVARNVGGVVAIAGSVIDLLAALGDVALTGATATFAVNGTAVELRVTGVLAKTINWVAGVTCHGG